MYSLNKLTDDEIPIPITHICKPERLGKDMTGLELHKFGLALFMTFIEVQNGKLIAVNMNPENGAPHVLVENPEKVLLYVWVKTDLAPNIPIYVPNETHAVITEISREYKAIPSFASITISCASQESNLLPKCGGEDCAVLNEFEAI
ncbi:MAG: hypothetical protein ABR927_12985 [Bacteroidales bacterium]|jgi:hypothetical protein